MSYGGGVDYFPVDTVTESADYTDMMGQASVLNQSRQPSSLRSNPTKTLIVLWVVALGLYWGMAYGFRGHNL